MNTALITQVAAFLWQEADMLDHGEYPQWLESWTTDGLYIVPINPDETDFENTLNYACDNAAMRAKRVARLGSGESISTSPVPRTIRSVSRFRVLADDGEVVTVRCAQNLREFRKDVQKHYSADVTFELVRTAGSFLIRRKIIRLINATDTLQGIGYIL
ncbi:aromatic-ring-hydroxylating dioxygenase subunit beta [Zoogloea sp. 1C4]|uniref:aromatic-ring-hydroxylating dioxygenase subunit beta n=1 Tax=Zoogloea sp. 1C4 TaxID=2570190 RepID=UPI0012924B08|nr:aromatic-ring-hydroxylating dioxygenase subunit beta [Zoogloea sp. 1C4]